VYQVPAGTRLLGQELIYVPECASTMEVAADRARESPAPEGLVVITDFQTSGRGQRGNEWESEPGKNLTFSLLLKPAFLRPSDQFHLNMVLSVALADYLEPMFPGQVSLKWPNDVMIDDKKVCGILIQNHIQGHSIHESVIGIGLNVNQTAFRQARATSLKLLTGTDFRLNHVLNDLLTAVEKRYLDLRAAPTNPFQEEYEEYLYWIHEARTFRHDGNDFLGMITGVDPSGRLLIKSAAGHRAYGVKEVEFVA
jgi:BirA family biotin operon repressor/biotin-[acetyl-CoA-carboxylase] ligase